MSIFQTLIDAFTNIIKKDELPPKNEEYEPNLDLERLYYPLNIEYELIENGVFIDYIKYSLERSCIYLYKVTDRENNIKYYLSESNNFEIDYRTGNCYISSITQYEKNRLLDLPNMFVTNYSNDFVQNRIFNEIISRLAIIAIRKQDNKSAQYKLNLQRETLSQRGHIQTIHDNKSIHNETFTTHIFLFEDQKVELLGRIYELIMPKETPKCEMDLLKRYKSILDKTQKTKNFGNLAYMAINIDDDGNYSLGLHSL